MSSSLPFPPSLPPSSLLSCSFLPPTEPSSPWAALFLLPKFMYSHLQQERWAVSLLSPRLGDLEEVLGLKSFPFPGWMFSWLSYCPSGWQCPLNQCCKLGEMPEFRLQSDRYNGWTLSQDGRVELLQERCLVSREALKEIVADLQWQLQKVVGLS